MKHLNIHGDCCLHYNYGGLWECCHSACGRALPKDKPVVVHYEPVNPTTGATSYLGSHRASWPGPQLLGVPLLVQDSWQSSKRNPQCLRINTTDWSSPEKLFELKPVQQDPSLPAMLIFDGRWFESVDQPGLDYLVSPQSSAPPHKLDPEDLRGLPTRKVEYCVACGGIGNHRLMCPTQKVKA